MQSSKEIETEFARDYFLKSFVFSFHQISFSPWLTVLWVSGMGLWSIIGPSSFCIFLFVWLLSVTSYFENDVIKMAETNSVLYGKGLAWYPFKRWNSLPKARCYSTSVNGREFSWLYLRKIKLLTDLFYTAGLTPFDKRKITLHGSKAMFIFWRNDWKTVCLFIFVYNCRHRIAFT